MGICSSNREVTNHVQVVAPQNSEHAAIEAQYGAILNPDHDKNLNKQYKYLYNVLKNETVGQGIKKTPGYESKVPLDKILAKRQEFWETRVEGNKETWNALKIACDGDDTSTAVAILEAAGIKLILKTLQMSYDPNGYRYDIPIFVINKPTKYANSKKEEVKEIKKEDITLKVKAKGATTKVKVNTTEKVQILMNKFREKFEGIDNDPKKEGIRLFFKGKELKPEHIIGSRLKKGNIITAFIKKL